MKSFNKENLITWSNRHKVKVGDKGYFASSITDLHSNIKGGYIHKLMNIYNNKCWCFSDGTFSYGFFLPVDAVKDDKTYRACRNVQEFSNAVDLSSINYADDSDYIYDLIDKTIHIRSKNTGTEYYTSIRSISVGENGYIKILMTGKSYLSFNDIFNNYEIEKNGEWVPFGVLDED